MDEVQLLGAAVVVALTVVWWVIHRLTARREDVRLPPRLPQSDKDFITGLRRRDEESDDPVERWRAIRRENESLRARLKATEWGNQRFTERIAAANQLADICAKQRDEAERRLAQAELEYSELALNYKVLLAADERLRADVAQLTEDLERSRRQPPAERAPR
jgi:septal ring factor EnvC (AmiA/AmiB activator)